jgi:HAD superfamily hydrolase (TIGR01490 family)
VPLSAFDLDCTLLQKNSSFEFCKHLYRKKILSFSALLYSCIYYIRYTYLGLSLTELHQAVFESLLVGLSQKLLAEEALIFAEMHWKSLVYFPAWQRLKSAQHRGDRTIILSNSPDFLVGVFAKKFHVDAWRASEYAVDSKQRLFKIRSILQGDDKACLLREFCLNWNIAHEDSTAYSDSILDIAFLQAAGTAVVVSPDASLQQISREAGWEEI